MKYIPHFLFFLAPLFCNSQEVISSGGDQFSNSEGSFTFTIGEPAVETFTGFQNILTQGFQQNYETILFVSPIPFLNNLSIYPNPFSEIITIQYSDGLKKDLTISLQDLNGKVVWIKKSNESAPSGSIDLSLSDLPDGVYFLNILFYNGLNSTYRIVKNN